MSEPANPAPRLRPADLALYYLIAGGLAALWGYSFGTGDQVEQLPIVLRAINPAFLANDFFTNASAAFGPRTVYAQFIALLVRLAPINSVYFALTALSNAFIAWVSALTARRLFDGSERAALLAAALVLTARTFWLGAGNTLYGTALVPELLAMPLLLGALYLGVCERPAWAALLAGLASLIHPLVGLETGAAALGALILAQLLRREFKGRALRNGLIGVGILAAFAALSLVPYARETRIDSQTFVEIVAVFRHPHHYLPSTFPLWQYVQAALFLAAAVLAWEFSRRSALNLRHATGYLAALALIFALACLGGWLFVEVFPSRLWATAQTFRMLYMLKWLGLLLVAGSSARLLEDRSADGSLLLLSALSPMALAFSSFLLAIRKWFARRGRPAPLLDFPVLLFAVLLILMIDAPTLRDAALLALFVTGAHLLLAGTPPWPARAAFALASAGVAAALLVAAPRLPQAYAARLPAPVFSVAAQQGEVADIAAFARAKTPAEAVFLTPPNFGSFRLQARRAIVVDFYAFPFQDAAMLEWRQRLLDCYGPTTLTGFDAVDEMRNHYDVIRAEEILAVQQKYGAAYAVLFKKTPTDFPVLYQTQTYKLVELP